MVLSRENRFLIFILILVALEAFLFLSGNFELNKKQKLEEEKLTQIKKTFDETEVLSKSFSIYDATDKKEIYNKNGNLVLPLASLSKTMTALVALENNESDYIFTVFKKSSEENKNNILNLNEKWKINDLVKFTLVSSSNTGALTLAQKDKNFIKKMNEKAILIGMKNTTFSNVTGLDINHKKAGSYGTSLDANIMAIYAFEKYPEIFYSTSFPNLELKNKENKKRNIKNTNILVNRIPNLIFSKTGYTNLAGGNLTVIFKNRIGKNIAITILGSSEQGRFNDIDKLIQKILSLEIN